MSDQQEWEQERERAIAHATWAEPVPGAPFPMSEDDYLRWPRQPYYKYELIDGLLVRTWRSAEVRRIIRNLAGVLQDYADEHSGYLVTTGINLGFPEPEELGEPAFQYSILMQWSPDKHCYIVTLPEWGAQTHGLTYEEAVHNGQVVLAMLIEHATIHGRPMPEPAWFPEPAREPEEDE